MGAYRIRFSLEPVTYMASYGLELLKRVLYGESEMARRCIYGVNGGPHARQQEA